MADTFQLQLQGSINTSYAVRVYDVDLVDTSAATIASLKSRGVAVVCYFSAGSSENWRPDFARFAAADMGNGLSGWAGERWLDTRSTNVREIMKSRMDLAVSKGCDGVDPDNVDGYQNNPGFPLTSTSQVDYNRFLAGEAHARSLKVGLKNAVDLLADLQPSFDFAVNEQCHQYSECSGYGVFVGAGKPVFNIEYDKTLISDPTKMAKMCSSSRTLGLRSVVLPLALNGAYRYSCD